MVEPGFEASTEEARVRCEMVLSASPGDHALAVQAVNDEYAEYINSRTVKQRKLLPEVPPPKFAAPRYCGVLQRLVNDYAAVSSRSAQQVAGQVGCARAAPALALGGPAPSGIDLILSGNTFTAPLPT
eukprot:6442945-Pyramimonas_sp.AAC.1